MLDYYCLLTVLLMRAIESFQSFFDACVGAWSTERTYHYLSIQEVERSHTEFVVNAIDPAGKAKVLSDNEYSTAIDLALLPGYHLEFNTVSEHGEKVSQSLNMLFVPDDIEAEVLTGAYLRDRAYEESKPKIAKFQFNTQSPEKFPMELLMTTHYTKVVSVDSITMMNPSLRIRRIFNYRRPPEGQPLSEIGLVGFGVEQKRD